MVNGFHVEGEPSKAVELLGSLFFDVWIHAEPVWKLVRWFTERAKTIRGADFGLPVVKMHNQTMQSPVVNLVSDLGG